MRISRGGIVKVLCVVGVAIGVLGFAYVGSMIPRASSSMFASPDETATAMFADAFGKTGAFRISVTTPSTVRDLIALHPRSMIRQGDWLVPVGFLGMPFLAWLSNTIIPHSAPFLTLLLVLSSLIPLFLLIRPMGRWAAWSSIAIYASFPTVLLYENRGLFPNLPVVAFAIWSVFLFRRAVTFDRIWKRITLFILASLALGIASAIRPIELVWILPWVIWAIFRRPQTTDHRPQTHVNHWTAVCGLWTIIPVLILITISFVALSMRTYPFNSTIQSQPAIGYLMKDQAQQSAIGNRQSVISKTESRTISSVWIGIHPRTLWQNVSNLAGGLLGVWIGAAIIGATWYSIRRRWTKQKTILTILIGWTIVSLLLLYGQTVYTDNIQMTAAIGNSFLRYLLPLAPLIAIGCGLLIQTIHERMQRLGNFVAIFCLACLVTIGIVNAVSMDAESILPTRNEILRYQSIRSLAEGMVPQGAIILSERNDKVFASGPFTAVSPLPDIETLKRLSSSGVPVFFYHRIIVSAESVPLPMLQSFAHHPWVTVFKAGNEGLYRIDGALPPL
ncbi:MAG: hypothetical protein WC477_01005 [Patescibacteria group bacterium]